MKCVSYLFVYNIPSLCTSCMGHTLVYLLYVTTLSACIECIVYKLYGSQVCLLTVCDNIECMY